MSNKNTLKAFMLLTLCITFSGCANHHAILGVPNFQIVDGDKVYRGGQPSPDGWGALQKLGVKTIIKLNKDAEGSDDAAKYLGMKVVEVSVPPSNLTERNDAPSPEQINKIFSALEKVNNEPVYVHCLHGQDRTGLIVGLYRVRYDHYTKEQAFNEMLDNGFHQNLFPGLTEAWEKFDGKSLPVGETQR